MGPLSAGHLQEGLETEVFEAVPHFVGSVGDFGLGEAFIWVDIEDQAVGVFDVVAAGAVPIRRPGQGSQRKDRLLRWSPIRSVPTD